MKAETILDSVVFQLTPTRTRYDLVIIANGKTEKIASGLLESFLAHLKTAKDQIAKGGYSIRLEPNPGTTTTWFTKDTVERFVRYVSTPEVLERVNTLESEILQISEAIAIQGSNNISSRTMDSRQSKWEGCSKDGKFDYGGDKEKLMVLSKHGKYRRLSTGSITREENSRCQLLTVLENRKTVLRKEQDMAFARAVAAGFDVDHMGNLILFSKTFGASRLLEACFRFVDLWKSKHKNGQLLETVRGDVVPFHSESSYTKSSSVIISGNDWKQKQYKETRIKSRDTLEVESNEKDNNVNSALKLSSRQLNSSHIEDKKVTSSDPWEPSRSQNYYRQIQNSTYPQWASHGPPVSQSYPIQGTTHYQSHPISASPSVENPEFRLDMNLNRYPKENNISSMESRTWHMNVFYQNGTDREETNSQSQNESEEEIHDLPCEARTRKHRKSSRSVNKAQVVDGQDADGGNWQTFQKLLMRVQNENVSSKKNSDQMAENSFNLQKGSLYNVTDGDESFVVPLRSNLHDEMVKDRRTVIDTNSDASKDYNGRMKNQQSYEPHELSIMPERRFEKCPVDFDPAKVFDVPVQNGIKESESKSVREELKGGLRNERKLSGSQNGLDKRKVNLMTMKGKSSKVNPLADAKARAEKLRAFKADLWKAKKEKEEEERRRLEALKRERQKRIAARTSSNIVQPPFHTHQTKGKKPTRLSPTSRNISKFSDALPTFFSPLRKSPRSSTDIIQSPLKPQQIGASMTTTPNSCTGSKFSDASPSSSSPLINLLRSSKSVSRLTHNLQGSPMLKPKRLYSSSSPIKRSPNNSGDVTQSTSRLNPDSSSPLQKLPMRSTPPSFSDSRKITKPQPLGFNGSTHLVRNGSEINKNLGHTQTRRVSYPQGSSMRCANSVSSLSIKESRVKSNPPTPSENKIRVSIEHSGKSKKSPDRMKAKKLVEVSSTLGNNVDDPIVEKSILLLENRMISDSSIQKSDTIVEIGIKSCEDGRRERIESVTQHIAPHFPPTLSLILGEYDASNKDKQPSSYEAVDPPNKNPRKVSTENPVEVPSIRALYVEESAASSTACGEHIDQSVFATDTQRIMTHPCSLTASTLVGEIHEINEKSHIKGSPKGIKELLKFRRKGQSSTSVELNATSSNNVPTLKDLMSKDSHSTNTPPKVARPFSLFLPCQARTSKKR